MPSTAQSFLATSIVSTANRPPSRTRCTTHRSGRLTRPVTTSPSHRPRAGRKVTISASQTMPAPRAPPAGPGPGGGREGHDRRQPEEAGAGARGKKKKIGSPAGHAQRGRGDDEAGERKQLGEGDQLPPQPREPAAAPFGRRGWL